jgi:hypothetical protein
VLLALANPRLYWRWEHAVHDGTACEQPACPGAQPDPQAVADMVHAFGSEWLVSFDARTGAAILPALFAHPERFQLVGIAEAAPELGKLSLWHVPR